MLPYFSQFHQPIWIFIGLLLLALVFFLHFRLRPKQNFSQMQLVKKIYKKHTFWYSLTLIIMSVITMLFFIILAGPYQSNSIEKEKKNGVDIQIVFDVSYSMIASDISPSRLEVAKEVLVSFLGKLSQDRVGVILFAGKPFYSVPLTYDYTFLQDFIKNVQIDTIQQGYDHLQGTAIGDALVMAAGILTREDEADQAREKVIVFITDGEANKGIDPELALKLLQEKSIKTYTIGVGKKEQTTITLPGFGGFIQNIVIGGVDEELLQKIAQETGALYFKADSKTTFQEIFETIAELEKKEIIQEKILLQKPLEREYSLFLLGLLLIFESLLYFKKIRISGI